MQHRLEADQGSSGEAPFDWLHIRNAILDWKTWVYALIYIGVAEPLYSLSLFTPTIISELGRFSRAQSQLLSTPPYALATIVTLLSALYSDRIKSRGVFVTFWMTVTCIGYAILIGNNPTHKPGVSYFAIFLCVSGVAVSKCSCYRIFSSILLTRKIRTGIPSTIACEFSSFAMHHIC